MEERRGRRRQRSEDASSYTVTTNAPVVSAAEAAATLEFLDELGEFLELEHHPVVASGHATAALEPIPFDTVSSSSHSSPMSTTYEPMEQLAGIEYIGADKEYDEAKGSNLESVKKKKKSSTQRQKEELIYLRTKVGQLERELNDMKVAFRGGPSDPETRPGDATSALVLSSSETCSLGRNSTSMWETMAQRQLKEKNRAELENAHLKQAMEGQIKLAKGLERMLRKRQIWDEVQEPSPFSIDTGEHESEIYELMAKSIETRIPSVDTIFEVGGVFGRGNLPMNEANTVHSDSEGLYIDFVDAYTIPFDFHAVARMTWKHMGMKDRKLKTVTVNTLIMEQTEESLTTKHLVTSGTAGEKRTTTTRSEYRRIMREDHVLMVWHSITENKGEPLSGKPGIHISQQGCCKILRAKTKDGSVATTILSLVRMKPKMATSTSSLLCDDDSVSLEESEGNLQVHQHPHEAGMFSEVVVSSFQQNVHIVRQNIENDLMDEFFEQQRAQCEIIALWKEAQGNKRHRFIKLMPQEFGIFSELSTRSESQIAPFAATFEAHGLSSSPICFKPLNQAQAAFNDELGIRVNIVKASVMPLDFLVTADATRKHTVVREVALLHITLTNQVIKQTEDSLVTVRVMARKGRSPCTIIYSAASASSSKTTCG